MTVPKIIIPRIEYIKMKRSSRPPMFARECKVITKVLKIRRRLYPRLISLRSRRILKDLKIVITPLISSEVFAEMKMLMKDPKIIIVSKMFQPSEK